MKQIETEDWCLSFVWKSDGSNQIRYRLSILVSVVYVNNIYVAVKNTTTSQAFSIQQLLHPTKVTICEWFMM